MKSLRWTLMVRCNVCPLRVPRSVGLRKRELRRWVRVVVRVAARGNRLRKRLNSLVLNPKSGGNR